MTALLRKDLYMVGSRMWSLLIVALIFSVTPQFNIIGTVYLLMLSMNLSQTSIAYDTQSRWDQFAAMLPIPPWEIVLSKYLVTMLTAFGGGCAATVVNYVQYKFLGGDISVPLTVALLFTVLTLNAVFLPIIYRLGVKRAQIILLPAYFGGAALLSAGLLMRNREVIRFVESIVWLLDRPALELISGSAALAAVSNVISFCLSVQFYANRRYGVYDL